MGLNFLENLGILTIFFVVSCIAICLYYVIKDRIDAWKKLHRNKCPFCGVYLHGYQYNYGKAKYNARYCSRCGMPLNETKDALDSINSRQECKALFLFNNEYREKMKKFGCESCEIFGNDCDGVSGLCDCGVIKEKK